jgi:ribonuclease HI
MLTLHFDGLYRSLPEQSIKDGKLLASGGLMAYGWLIYRGEKMVARGHGVVARGRDATSNVAEFLALVEGLEALNDLGVNGEPVEVRGDARSIIEQMQGKAAVNSESIKPLYRQARGLAGRLTYVQWTWTPRRQNRAADQLTRLALRQARWDEANFYTTVQSIFSSPGHARSSRKFLPLLDLRVYQPVQ